MQRIRYYYSALLDDDLLGWAQTPRGMKCRRYINVDNIKAVGSEAVAWQKYYTPNKRRTGVTMGA